MQFLTAREVVKAQLVFNHVQRGNMLMLEDARARAAAEFRAALDLDPDNQFARERLAEATRERRRRCHEPCPSESRILAKFTSNPRTAGQPSITAGKFAACSPSWRRHTE